MIGLFGDGLGGWRMLEGGLIISARMSWGRIGVPYWDEATGSDPDVDIHFILLWGDDGEG